MVNLRDSFIAFSRYLKSYRVFLNGSLAEYAICTVIFLVLTLLYTNSLFADLSSQVFTSVPADGTGGFLWYNFAQSGLDPILHHSDMVNFPNGEDIGGITFITYLGLWLPIRILSFVFGAVIGINLFMIFGYILTAVSMYWLVKKLTSSTPVAYFAAFIVSFAPYTLYKSLDHIAYILTYIFIFIVAAFIGFWNKPTVFRAVIFAATIALAFYTDGYYLLLASVLVAGLCVAGILYGMFVKMKKKDYTRRLKYGLLSFGVLIVLILPIFSLQVFSGSKVKESLDDRRPNIATEMQVYRAKPIDFIIPAMTNPFLQDNPTFKAIHDVKNERSNPYESTNYLGFTLILLSAVGGIILIKRLLLKKRLSPGVLSRSEERNILLVTTMTIVTVPLMLSFMFSPEVNILGLTIKLPGQLFIDYNITLWRVMSRFFVPLHFIVALFASLSLWLIFKLIQKPKDKRNIIPWQVVTICVLVIFVAAEYATTINRPSFDFKNENQGYFWLKDQSEIKSIVELPVVDPLDYSTAYYVTSQVVHGKKLVNSKENQKTSLTNILGGVDNPETIDWAIKRGADAVVTHNRACEAVAWGSLVYKNDSVVKGALCIYTLNKTKSVDGNFIKYTSGFEHRPNADDQERAAFNSNEAQLLITDESFSISNEFNKVELSGKLESFVESDLGRSTFVLEQHGKEVYSSLIESEVSNIKVIIDNDAPLTLKLTLPSNRQVGKWQYVLNNVTVRSI